MINAVTPTVIAISSGPNLCCARCTHVVKADQPRYKAGRYTYGQCCILKVAPEALEVICK